MHRDKTVWSDYLIWIESECHCIGLLFTEFVTDTNDLIVKVLNR